MSKLCCLVSRLLAGHAVIAYANGTSIKIEQRINLKFLVKLKKIPTECLKFLKEVYGEDVMSRTQIFEWHKRFKNGHEKVEDDPKSGRPSTSKTDENIARTSRE